MSNPGEWRPRVLICGTGFGRVYLSAVRRPGMPFELAGILARGSRRSVACAQRYQVPLYTEVDALPGGLELACVVVNAGINGGRGAELAQELMSRGMHVLQEHPLDQSELAACLRQARRSGVMYQVNSHYIHVPAVECFIRAARRLTERQAPLFVDAISSFQVLYTLIDILGQVLGGIRPWSLTVAPEPAGAPAVLRSVNVDLGGVPVSLRIQNQLDPRRRDNGPHIMHRVTLATEGGNLLLATTQGPVLWNPRLHMPEDYPQAVTVRESAAGHLDLPSVRCLTASAGPSYRDVIADEWPLAVARSLTGLRAAILAGGDPLTGGRYHLAVSRLVAAITAQLGRPEVRAAGDPAILEAAEAVAGAPGAGRSQPLANSQPSPSAR
ncbi:MAG: Gfo/Idh/MocA family oxidoreductase [Streptosporangiaceae bacterium]|nr:Gfo/Idh/MocA family oxidoreductase [Streptosporangiaceae bacterium]